MIGTLEQVVRLRIMIGLVLRTQYDPRGAETRHEDGKRRATGRKGFGQPRGSQNQREPNRDACRLAIKIATHEPVHLTAQRHNSSCYTKTKQFDLEHFNSRCPKNNHSHSTTTTTFTSF
jgi:hypothetical protein